MKRDMDLVRKILLAVEASELPLSSSHITVDGADDGQIAYNVGLLVQAELLSGMDAEGLIWIQLSLTWEGHDFLDAARNDTVWNKVKGAAKTMPIAALKALLTAVLIDEGKKLLHLPQ